MGAVVANILAMFLAEERVGAARSSGEAFQILTADTISGAVLPDGVGLSMLCASSLLLVGVLLLNISLWRTSAGEAAFHATVAAACTRRPFTDMMSALLSNTGIRILAIFFDLVRIRAISF